MDLGASSLVGVFLPRGSEEACNALYTEITEAVMGAIYPKLVGHLEGSQVVKKIHACKTIDELKQVEFTTVYPELFIDLVATVNAEERLTNDSERLFIAARVADNLIFGAHEWISGSVRQRAQVITTTPPGKRIIEPNEFINRGKKGKIITL